MEEFSGAGGRFVRDFGRSAGLIRPGIAALVCVLAAVLAFPGQAVSTPTADAALRGFNGRLARVLEPHSTVRGNSVTVRVRVRRTVRSFSAQIGKREVGGLFVRRHRGRLRVARLRIGRKTGLKHGLNRLEVRVHSRHKAGDYEVRDFALVRRAPRLLRVGGPRRSAGKARVRLRLAGKRVAVHLRLNGRRVRLPASARRGRRLRIVWLAGDEGLRHGRNLLRVTAVDRRGGRFAVERRRIFIRRTAPIPGAGHSRRVFVKDRVRLNARGTRAAYLPPSLRYRWRIVRKPRGSRARLRGATTRRPRLRPDLPGRYRLRMTVVERIPGRASARPGAGARAVASDTTTLSAMPDSRGMGTAVNTMDHGGVTVGDNHYAPPDPSEPLQLVVLDRKYLTLLQNLSFTGDTDGTEALDAAVFGLGSNTIAVIATRGTGVAPTTDTGSFNNLNAAVMQLGGRPISTAAAQTPLGSCVKPTHVCGGFSVIGTPGFAAGQGAVNEGLGALGDAGTVGALTGYLQFDQTYTLHTFVPGDYVAFDTTASGLPTSGKSQTQAVIEVDHATYRSQQLVPPVVAGAYVLVLDAGTLAFREDGTFALPGGPAANIPVSTVAGDEQEMAALLNKYANDPSALVFVQTIGLPGRWDSQPQVAQGWNEVATALQAFGGHRTLFNALSDDSYAQVGPGDPPAASSVRIASQAASRSPGQLAGTLARNDSGQFYADNASGTDEFVGNLAQVAYQPPAPGGWPLRDIKPYPAVMQCVATALDLKYPIEESYYAVAEPWGDDNTELQALTMSDLAGQCDTSSFNATDLATVKTQLGKEFTYVGKVRSSLHEMQAAFGWTQVGSDTSLQHAADEVRRSITAAPDAAKVSYDGLGIADEVIYVIGAVAELAGQEEAAVGIELAASGLGLVDETTLDDQGRPELAQTITDTDVSGLANDLNTRYGQALWHFDQVGDMLVSDWGKLETAGKNFSPAGPWEWTSEKEGQVPGPLELAATRFAYTALFPKAYPALLRGTKGDATFELPDNPSLYSCWWYPYAGGSPNHLETDHTPWLPFMFGGGLTPVISAGTPNVRENWVYSTAVDPSNAIAPAGNIAQYWYAPGTPKPSLLSDMYDQNFSDTVQMPPLQPLEFVLSMSDQLQVLTISHTSSTFHTEDGSPEQNICTGSISGWPGGL